MLQFTNVLTFFPLRLREDHAHGHVLLLCEDPSYKESPLQQLHVGYP